MALALLLLLPLLAASELEVEGGYELEIELPYIDDSPDEGYQAIATDLRVYTDEGVELLAAERNGEDVYLKLMVMAPTPCHKVDYKVEQKVDDDGYVEAYVYLSFYSSGEICTQVITPQNVDVRFKTDPQLPLKVEVKRTKFEPYEYTYEYSYEYRYVGEIPYELEVEGNRAKVYIKGCYDYSVLELNCTNCFEIRVRPAGTCEETEIYLNVDANYPVDVKVLLEGNFDTNIPLPPVMDLNTLCREIVAELNKYDPVAAKEFAIRCEAGDYYAVKEKACDVLEKLDKNAYYRVCESYYEVNGVMVKAEERARIEAQIKNVLETPVDINKTVEELRKEIEKLKQEIERYKEELRKLRIKVEELQRKLLITPEGIVDPVTGEKIEVPEVEIEVEYEGKPLIIKKELNDIYMELNGPIKVKVEVEVPSIAIDKNAIEVNGKVIKVLPDEVIQRIQEQIRNAILEQLRLTIENNKPVYEVEAKAQGRLFFLIPIEIPVKAYIDAETGQEIKVEKPWWAIFVIG